jgi:hypothetical protein
LKYSRKMKDEEMDGCDPILDFGGRLWLLETESEEGCLGYRALQLAYNLKDMPLRMVRRGWSNL